MKQSFSSVTLDMARGPSRQSVKKKDPMEVVDRLLKADRAKHAEIEKARKLKKEQEEKKLLDMKKMH